MKRILLALLTLLSVAAFSQTKTAYDKSLADSLGADQYGMKMYVLVLLKTGTNKTDDKRLTDSLFAGHMKNIGKLVADGKLIIAGPMRKNEKSLRGIFILNAKNKEEGEALLQTDPAIQSKLLEAEIYEWYASAALPMYLKYHEKVEKQSH